MRCAVYTNEQVATLLKSLNREVAGLRADIRAISSTPASAPVSGVAAAPVTIPERGEKVAKVVLFCIGHGQPDASKACAREFGAEGLAAHNLWAHK